MPESVDSPAPDRTTTSPSATRSARASRACAGVAPSPVLSRAVGAAVTSPWSPDDGRRAGSSGQLAIEAGEQLAVDPAQPLRRKGALEEPADPARALPSRA